MAGLKHYEKPDGSASWKGLLCAAGCTLAALLACTDYNGIGVLIICALYLTRGDRKRQCIVGAVLFAWELTAPLAFVLVWFYNGQRGRCTPAMQKVFYWFYPVHLSVLAAVTNLIFVIERPLSRNEFRGGGLLVSENGKSPVISKNHRAFSWRSRRDLNPRAVV